MVSYCSFTLEFSIEQNTLIIYGKHGENAYNPSEKN